MEKIITAIVKALLSFFSLKWEAAEREAAEWEAKAMRGKLDSIKRADAVEARIEAVVPTRIATNAASWNARATSTLLLLIACLFFTGCPFVKYVYIEGRWPVVSVPDRPVVPDEPLEFTPRETTLVGYAQVLEMKIGAYNEAAKWHNEEHGYSDPEGGGSDGP